MKKKIRLLSLIMMTVTALTFFAMTANASEENVSIPSLISEDDKNDEFTQQTSSDFIVGDEFTAYVSVDMLNLRCGPSTDYNIIKVLKKDQSVTIITKINGWYVVHTDNDGYIGCVSEKYLHFKDSESDITENNTGNTPEITLLNLINNTRKQNGLKELKLNTELSRVALHKAQDMVENNYFDHNSKIYGTPFEMIKSYGINFRAAAENIAGNQSVEGAFYAWMNSSGHAANILNSTYTDTGIGICVSPTYGLMLVQMFIA
ncbi:MAG: SCP-like extracellular protein [Ruminococcaceae bacterium]|nr:SCP-like extracellular protein [Oscillospiraceae bacterium]